MRNLLVKNEFKFVNSIEYTTFYASVKALPFLLNILALPPDFPLIFHGPYAIIIACW